MVHSIASTPGQVAAGQVVTPFERPELVADAARQVTPTQETLNGNRTGSASAQGGNNAQESAAPSSLENTLAQINDSMKAWSTGIRFNMDDEAQRLVVSIVDNATGDVIRTVPSDAVLRVAKMIVQMQGNTVNTRI